MTWTFYVLRCSDGSLYAGITTDVERRLRQHNGDLAGGAKYTRARRPVVLVFTRSFPDRSSAAREEHRFKKLSRQQKLMEIR